eukprot:INCI16348.1.p1 GENE.INCI16348.1~~INCI16348.1.p1  ORF type:complete len:1339 (+),score=206.41 INCI16348.1:162-4178(+)
MLSSARLGAEERVEGAGGGGSSSKVVCRDFIVVYVNGRRHELSARSAAAASSGFLDDLPGSTLLDFLRSPALRLRGSKYGCGVGQCGACTVVLSKFSAATGAVSTFPVNACIFPLLLCDGASVTTIEGLGDTANPHPIQQRVARLHATQCGFCTPGFVMSMYAALVSSSVDSSSSSSSNPRSTCQPSMERMEASVQGNLCRCTGYRPLLDVAKTFGADFPSEKPPAPTIDEAKGLTTTTVRSCHKLHLLEPALDPRPVSVDSDVTTASEQRYPFPPELRDLSPTRLAISSQTVSLKNQRWWHRPATLDQVAELRSADKEARIIAGETDFKRPERESNWNYIDLSVVPECQSGIQEVEGTLRIGAATTLAHIVEVLGQHRISYLRGLAQALAHFGSPQARASTAIASVLRATDVSPVLHALQATVDVVRKGADGHANMRSLPIADIRIDGVQSGPIARPVQGATSFERQVDVPVAIRIPIQANESVPSATASFCGAYRAAPKPLGAQGTISLALRADCAAVDCELGNVHVFVSGVCPLPGMPALRAVKTTKVLSGMKLCDMFEDVLPHVDITAAESDELELQHDAPQIRHSLASVVVDAVCHDMLAHSATAGADGVAVNESLKPHQDCMTTLAVSLLQRAVSALKSYVQGEDLVLQSARASLVQHCSSGQQTYTISSDDISSTISTADPQHMHEPAPARDSSPEPTNNNQGAIASSSSHSRRFPVGAPLPHVAALQQCTGEALFVDDIDPPRGCLEAAMVVSTHAHARVISVDASKALALPGVHDYVDHRDLPPPDKVPAENAYVSTVRRSTPVTADSNDYVFADGLVACVGALIGLVVADSVAIARRAVKLVQVKYEALPAVLSIEEAMEKNPPALHDYDHCLLAGDVEASLSLAPHVISGSMYVGGQEHFYMEPHALLAVPGERHGEMTIHSCTQCVAKTTKLVAACLGVSEAHVRTVVRRIGGGFGGKETLSTYRAAAVAVAAAKLKRAVRICLSREEDMLASGQSHPFRGSWKAGFDASGKLHAADVELVCNAGSTICCSNVVMDRGIAHFQNAYHFPALRVVGRLAYTHLPGNTAFRGFGVPQSAMICENMVEAIGRFLRISPEEVRRVNLLPSEGVVHMATGQCLPASHLPRIWEDLDTSAEILARRKEIAAFNSTNPWRKRGIAVVPTCYGINFPLKYLNQGASYVLVYTDGSVLVSHGGTEMGQGLNTKVIQVAAQALGINSDLIRIAECASDRIHNTSPTAASVGADLNGMATLNACEQIVARLEAVELKPHPKIAPDHPNYNWLCKVYWAYKEQVSLGALGFHGSPCVAGTFTHVISASHVQYSLNLFL